MKLLSNTEFRSAELGLLNYFDSFCRCNGLKYSLAEGTLIGAVRHKGFIPWDDDIDVIMMRSEYEKMLSLFNDGRYRIVKAHDNSIYPYSFVRIEDTQTKVVFDNKDKHSVYNGGAWMDIFPIDNFPDDPKVFKKLERCIFLYSNLYRIKTRKHWCKSLGIINNFAWVAGTILLMPISKRFCRKKLFVLMTRYNTVETKYKGYWTNYWHKPWVFPSSAFTGYTELEFEGKLYSVIKGYDEYLRSEYGDYMQLPPKEKQIAKHGFTIYSVE